MNIEKQCGVCEKSPAAFDNSNAPLSQVWLERVWHEVPMCSVCGEKIIQASMLYRITQDIGWYVDIANIYKKAHGAETNPAAPRVLPNSTVIVLDGGVVIDGVRFFSAW